MDRLPSQGRLSEAAHGRTLASVEVPLLAHARMRRPGVSDGWFTPEPKLAELREADREYHGLCIDIQEPDVLPADLPLAEIEAAAARLLNAVRELREAQG